MFITSLYPYYESEVTFLYIIPLIILIVAYCWYGIIAGFIAIFLCWFYLFGTLHAIEVPIFEFICLFVASVVIASLYCFTKERYHKLQLLNELLQNIHIGILVSREQDTAYAYNNIAFNLLNFTEGIENGDKRNAELLRAYGLNAKVEEVLKNRKNTSYSFYVNDRSLVAHISFHVDVVDYVAMAVTTIIDCTEEERLKRLKGDLIDFATHQVNAPLTAINNYAEILSLKYDTAHEFRDKIQKNTEQISFAIQNIPDIYTLNDDKDLKDTLKFKYCEAESLFADVIDPLSSLLERKSLRIESVVHHEQALYVDRQHIEFVLTCLAHNAIKYSMNGSVIHFVSEKFGGSMAKIKITNSCDKSVDIDIDTIFTKGVIGSKGHTGIGLAYARSVALAHGGNISACLERGIFTLAVILPLAEEKLSYKAKSLADRFKETENVYALKNLKVAEAPKKVYGKKDNDDE